MILQPLLQRLLAVLSLLVLLAGTGIAADTKTNPATAKKGKVTHGAIAWHRDSGSYGYSHDLTNAKDAAVTALNQCANARCEVVLALRSECGAVANGPKGFKVQKGHTQAEAETKALKACGPGCKPVAWVCTR
jgi:Domain of unknown function (DUF4189)